MTLTLPSNRREWHELRRQVLSATEQRIHFTLLAGRNAWPAPVPTGLILPTRPGPTVGRGITCELLLGFCSKLARFFNRQNRRAHRLGRLLAISRTFRRLD